MRILVGAAPIAVRDDRDAQSWGSAAPDDFASQGACPARLEMFQDTLNAKARAEAARQQERIAAREAR